MIASLLFGVLSAASSPAATIMVIRERKAKGIFTDTLLATVAIDDPICVIPLPALWGGFAVVLSRMARRFSFFTTVLKPIGIAAAVALGAAIGFAVVYLARK